MPGRGGRNRNKLPFYYWNHVAPSQPEAQAVAVDLGLEFPSPENATSLNPKTVGGQNSNFRSGIVYPIRRLIATGEDTPANLALLLGPLWESKESVLIKKTRIEVLLCPPAGSPAHTTSQHLDNGCPRWTPRASNQEEQAELMKVRDMKAAIVKQTGGRKDVTSNDIRQILVGMGGDWSEHLPTFELAMNNTDQGVGKQG